MSIEKDFVFFKKDKLFLLDKFSLFVLFIQIFLKRRGGVFNLLLNFKFQRTPSLGLQVGNSLWDPYGKELLLIFIPSLLIFIPPLMILIPIQIRIKSTPLRGRIKITRKNLNPK